MLTVLALAAAGAAAHAGDPPAKAATPTFRGIADLSDVVQTVSSFSEDKQAVTVLFRNLTAEVSRKGGPAVNTRVTTVVLPVVAADGPAAVTQDVRGFVMVSGKARVSLVVHAAGKTTVVALKKAEAKPVERADSAAVKQSREKAAAQAKLKNLPAAPEKGPHAYDFTHRITGTVPAGAGYQVTFLLLAERDTDAEEDGAFVTVDSLDVEVASPKAKK